MNNGEIKKAGGKKALTQEIATRQSDPNFYGALGFLPNPDEVLRKLGKSHEVFDAIAQDAHVMGERRSTRAGLLGFEYQAVPGGDNTADMRAFELCQRWMTEQAPAPGLTWSDTIWAMAQGVYRGYQVHELVWQRFGNEIMPVKFVDRPSRRFVYGLENELRLKTKEHMMNGLAVGAYKFIVTRHMPSYDNPYGEALFSSCFWPYTFKHAGYKYFSKFCERFGMPWTVLEYPAGTSTDNVTEMVDVAAAMIEDAIVAVPQGGSANLVTASVGASALPQERMIALCNKEMSKVLTSQTLATEIDGEGSRAAAETHADRESGVQQSDRMVICASFNQVFAWITEINVAGAKPPTFKFFQEETTRAKEIEALDKARFFMDVPVAYAHERTNIPLPKKGEAVLPQTGGAPASGPEFSACPGCGQVHEFAGNQEDDVDRLAQQAAAEAAPIIAEMAAPIKQLLASVESFEEFEAGLLKMYPAMDESRLAELNQQVLMAGVLVGINDAKA